MTVILFLIPIALFLGGLGLFGFLWAMRSGQFDDLDGAAQRILFDDEPQAGGAKAGGTEEGDRPPDHPLGKTG
jgi:cbb3-type cytochrome oxidase maturation protein